MSEMSSKFLGGLNKAGKGRLANPTSSSYRLGCFACQRGSGGGLKTPLVGCRLHHVAEEMPYININYHDCKSKSNPDHTNAQGGSLIRSRSRNKGQSERAAA